MSHHTPTPNDQKPDYDDSTVRLKPLLLFFFWSTVFCAAVFVSMRWVLNDLEARDFEKRQEMPAFVSERVLPPVDQPRLQARPVVELSVHRAFEQSLIDNGVAGVHFYTLNKSKATLKIYQSLGIKKSTALRS